MGVFLGWGGGGRVAGEGEGYGMRVIGKGDG